MSAPTVADSPSPTGPGVKVTVVLPVASVVMFQVKPRDVRLVRVGATAVAGGAGHAAGRQPVVMREDSRQTPSQTTNPVGQVPAGGSKVALPFEPVEVL